MKYFIRSKKFFSKDNNRAINSIMSVMEHINIRPKQLGAEKRENCKFTNLQVLTLLILMPFFLVKNVSRYLDSGLRNLFVCEKDMFYRYYE